MNIIKKVLFSALLLLSAGLITSLPARATSTPNLTAITVIPASAVVGVGDQSAFAASANYSDGASRRLPFNKAYLTSTLLENGKVLIAGGYDGNSAPWSFAEAELYDPASGSFSPTGSMSTIRDSHTATRLADGKVLVTGGFADYLIINSAELYNPVNGNFHVTGSMAETRAYHTATLLADGRVLVTGGYGDTAGVLTTAELYNPATGTFNATGSMIIARESHTATLLGNGKVLIVGGGTNVTELYDPLTGTFSETGPLTFLRYGHAANLLADGKVLVIGGGSTTAELYDPVTGTFSDAGLMLADRSWHTATLLANGKALIAGGGSDAELYDPVTATFSATSTMIESRYVHVATLLGNGNVIVIGGGNVSMAELYNTSAGTWQDAGYPQPPLVWSNSNSSVASDQLLNGWYYLTGLSPGTTTVTATLGNFRSNVLLTVAIPPTAFAGLSQNVDAGTNVQLIGSGTADGYIASYDWFQYGGPAVTLVNSNTAMPSFTAPYVNDTLWFQLIVTDNIGLKALANTAVTVSIPTSSTSSTTTLGGGTSTTVASTTTTTTVSNNCTDGRCDAEYYCSGCHSGLTVNGVAVGGGARFCQQRTATEWTSTINRMNAKNCGVPAANVERIVNYLVSLGTGGGPNTTLVPTTTTTTTTSGGGTTTTSSMTTTTSAGATTTSPNTTTTSLVPTTLTTTSLAGPTTTSTTTVATTTTTTKCQTYVNGTTNYPYSGTGSCHGHGDNGTGDHNVREEKWCQQHMDHLNSSGNHTHAYPHSACM